MLYGMTFRMVDPAAALTVSLNNILGSLDSVSSSSLDSVSEVRASRVHSAEGVVASLAGDGR